MKAASKPHGSNRLTGNYRFWKTLCMKKDDRHVWKQRPEAALVFIIKGVVEAEEGAEKQSVAGGEFFLIPPSGHCSITAMEDAYLMACLFDVQHLLPIKSATGDLALNKADMPQGFLILKTDRLMTLSLLTTDRFIRDGLDADDLLEVKRRELLTLLTFVYPRRELALLLHPVVGREAEFRNFVLSNHANIKTVEEFARLASYSTSGFIKKFKRCFGRSPYQWMSGQKAERILREITVGQSSLKALSIQYDFSSYQHFASFCKTQFGASPTELRNRARSDTGDLTRKRR